MNKLLAWDQRQGGGRTHGDPMGDCGRPLVMRLIASSTVRLSVRLPLPGLPSTMNRMGFSSVPSPWLNTSLTRECDVI